MLEIYKMIWATLNGAQKTVAIIATIALMVYMFTCTGNPYLNVVAIPTVSLVWIMLMIYIVEEWAPKNKNKK